MSEEPEFNADEATAYFMQLKRARAKMKAKFEEDDAVLVAEQDRIKDTMMAFLVKQGLNNAPSAHGVFYKKLKTKPSATDWTALYNWIKETDGFHFLHKRISSEAVNDYLELHKDDPDGGLPPGIAVVKEYDIEVRKS